MGSGMEGYFLGSHVGKPKINRWILLGSPQYSFIIMEYIQWVTLGYTISQNNSLTMKQVNVWRILIFEPPTEGKVYVSWGEGFILR